MSTSTDGRIPRRAVTGYALGSIGTGGFGTLPGLVLAYYLTDTLAVPALLASLVVIVPKVWDVLIDPVIGALSDRDAVRRQSRTRLLAIGAVTLPIGFIGMFAAPTDLPPALAGVWVMVFFVLATTSFSLFQVPYVALPADLTSDYRERTRLMAWRIAVLALGILLVGAGGPAVRDAFSDSVTGYLVMGIAVAALLLIGMVATAIGVRGRRPVAATASQARASLLRDWTAGMRAFRDLPAYRILLIVFVLQALATGIMLAAAQYVATYILGSASALTFLFVSLVAPAILVMPLWTKLSDRLGKRATLAMATALFAVASLSLVGLLWAPGWWLYIPVALAGVAYAGMQMFPLAMLPDVISAAGRERGGAMGGLWTAGETSGLALGPAVVLIMLSIGAFESSGAGVVAIQPDSALAAIILAFSLVPAVITAVSLVVLRRYREPIPMKGTT